jgi:CelD/BcsL family acetyltransferase involved in cellulose biosynthesis
VRAFRPVGSLPRMLRLERVELADVDWHELDAYGDRSPFQTREWLDFLAATQGGDPVVARLVDGGRTAGWFSGMVVRRLGVRILGSPFQGWTTGPMGFNLEPGVDRRAAVDALLRFGFGELRCLHVELLDRRLDFDQLVDVRGEATTYESFEIDLTRPEEELFGAMSSACRRAVRKSEKSGVVVEIATADGFADEYYAQLGDVFAKQDLSPPYGAERVRELIDRVGPSGRLLLLRALSPDGKRIATAIFPAYNDIAFFWGGASWREDQILRPNEAVFWFAIRELKRRGIAVLDMGGGGEYKRKYGVQEVRVPFLRASRMRAVLAARNVAQRIYWKVATRR